MTIHWVNHKNTDQLDLFIENRVLNIRSKINDAVQELKKSKTEEDIIEKHGAIGLPWMKDIHKQIKDGKMKSAKTIKKANEPLQGEELTNFNKCVITTKPLNSKKQGKF